MGHSDRPQRLTVAAVADRLGISEDAVRSRIKRGTLRSFREGGTVYVLLDADRPTTSEPTDQATDPKDELIAVLRAQLEQANTRDRENRRIIAGLVQRIPELEAPPASPEEAERVAQSAGGVEDPGKDAEPEATTSQGSQRRSWWRRWFGG